MRWIVGDVQGCARELETLLREVRFDPGRDELWTAGDLINRGPDSLATARLWRDVGGRGVVGNHEVYALLAASGRWPRKPQRDTLEALFRAPDGPELLDRLRALPALARLPGDGDGLPDVWVVHAGLHPTWRDLNAMLPILDPPVHDDAWLQSPAVHFATRVRCCTAEGELCPEVGPPERCEGPCRPWDAYYEGPDLVVHGHWAWRRHYRGERTLGLDDACVHGGTLTAYCPEEDRVVQIPSRTDVGRGR